MSVLTRAFLSFVRPPWPVAVSDADMEQHAQALSGRDDEDELKRLWRRTGAQQDLEAFMLARIVSLTAQVQALQSALNVYQMQDLARVHHSHYAEGRIYRETHVGR